MKKKICPVCDSELLSGNYCRICKKIVWEPRYENRNFNLNESRRSKPAFYDADEARTPKEPPPVVKKSRPGPLYQPSSKKNPLPVSVVMTTIAAAFCLFVWISVKINMTGQGISGDIFFREEWLTQEELWEDGDIGQYQEIEISEEEAKSAGTACGWYLHSGLTAETAKKAMEEFLAGYETPVVSENFTDNWKYIYDDGSEETCYASGTSYFIGSAGTDSACITEFNYDTATGQVHYFYVTESDIEFVCDAVLKMAEVTDDSDSVKSVILEELEAQVRLLPYSDPEDYNDELWVWGDDWNVYGYLYDDNYFVWVEANLRDENYAKSECAPE